MRNTITFSGFVLLFLGLGTFAPHIQAQTINEAEAETAFSIYIDLGNDSGEWANNNVCDDPRFEGVGVDDVVVPEDIGKDATDCKLELDMGLARVRADFIAFGEDASDWSNDGVCDDPRFVAEDKAGEMVALSDDVNKDASDCFAAYEQQQIEAKLSFE